MRFEVGPFKSEADARLAASVYVNSSDNTTTYTITAVQKDPHGRWYAYIKAS
jgi:hypothetical protein